MVPPHSSPQPLTAASNPLDDAARHARLGRQHAVAKVRRSMVLDAARSAFAELGLEGASLREIARRAGYTPGALYSYFSSKEEVYAALLSESLDRLNHAVETAQPGGAASPGDLARAKATAFFEFYRRHPRDLDLGFYLFRGMRPRGLTPALNDALNARLQDALGPTRDALVAAGLAPAQAHLEVTALFAHVAGLLLLTHTGRIRMFQLAPAPLFDRYLDGLLARIAAPCEARRSA